MKKIKIAICHSKLNMGGIQKTLINYLNIIDYSKFEVDLYLISADGELVDLVPSNVNIIIIPVRKGLSNKLLSKVVTYLIRDRKFKHTYQYINNKEYDISIGFDGYTSVSDYYAGFLNAKKKIVWVHSDYYERRSKDKFFKYKLAAMRKKYYLFDIIITVSDSSANSFSKLFPEFSTLLETCGNPVEKVDDVEIKCDVKLDQTKFNLLSIGAFLPVKGFERLIQIHSSLIGQIDNLHTTIVGDGPQFAYIERLILKNGLSESISLVGKQKNVFEIMKQADLYVLSSFYEGYPGVLIESLSVGLPILVPKVSGAIDIALNVAGKGMAIICENNTESIADGILEYSNADDKQKIKLNIDSYNRQIMSKLSQIIKSRPHF